MKLPNNYRETQAFTGEVRRLAPGGHVCVIQGARVEQSRNGRDMLVVRFDIAENGNYGFYREMYDRALKYNPQAAWPGVYRVVIADENGNCTGFFKGLIAAIEESNEGYSFERVNADERTLSGKKLGLVFREEEYQGRDGKIRTAVRPAWAVPADRADEADIPAKRTLENPIAPPPPAYEADDTNDDLPF